HGKEAADQAAETARITFEEGKAADTLPVIEVQTGELKEGIPAFKILGLVTSDSNGASRRLIRGGGAKLNDQKITDENLLISDADLNADGVIKISAGKKKHALLRAV
ncbi:MAG: tyrosine--tRNA ligase, partial [Rickettsiales bacterium]|nr:tyrosine--tRNA ligase [Rickettsiales bacterium]